MKPSLLAPLLCALCSVGSARGAVVAIDYYRLGEYDQPIGSTVGGDVTRDSGANVAGANDLAGHVTGEFEFEHLRPAYYRQTENSPAAIKLGSTVSMGFESIDTRSVAYDSAQPASLASMNLGVEGWFKPESFDRDMGLVYNGDQAAGRGFGLFIVGGTYRAYLAGVGFIDSGITAREEWTYFALVLDGGVARLFVNGTSPVQTTAATPAPAAAGDTFVIGANRRFGSGNNAHFLGEVDEVRVFEFQQGAFDASSDLLFAAPEPTAGLSFLASIGGLAGCRRLRRLT